MTVSQAARQILDFWFAATNQPFWFEKNPDFDAACQVQAEALHQSAAAGDLADWQQTPLGALALVILLDQIPRNLYRGEARAFATDAKARAVSRAALDRGFDRGLTEEQRMFLYLPFEHSEDLADQRRSVALFASLTGHPDWLPWAERHAEIIERFGRFPHRNGVLGRISTAEETEFLAGPNSSF